MIEVSAYEAKTHLSQLLSKVQQGEHIKITKHKIPVAYLIPVDHSHLHTIKNVHLAFKEFRKGKTLQTESVSQFIEEGRR